MFVHPVIIIIIISDEINVTKCNIKKLLGHDRTVYIVIEQRLDMNDEINKFLDDDERLDRGSTPLAGR
jgi:hypothetical protein